MLTKILEGLKERVRGKSMTTREGCWHTNSPEAASSRKVKQPQSRFRDESRRNHYTTYLQIISSVIRKIKGTQIEVKLHLFADHNCVRRKSQRKCKNLLDLITRFSKAEQYKVKIQNSAVFLYTGSAKNPLHFMMALVVLNYL